MQRIIFLRCLLFISIMSFVCIEAFAQPANNTCATATPLIVGNGSCSNPINGTNAGATGSGISPSCNSYAGGDIWYSFVAPVGGALIIETSYDASGTFLDTGLGLYASCGGTILACDADSGVGSNAQLNLSGLTAGATYYVAVWEWSNDFVGSFDICAWTLPVPPSNDECVNATLVTVNNDLSCTNFASGTVASATQSTNPLTCQGSYDDDVWFQFVAISTDHEVVINNIVGPVVDMVYQFSTGTCGALTEILCHDTPDVGFTATGLTVGATYYLRVATFVSSPAQTTFDICIGTQALSPPANDECVNAIPLALGSGACGTPLNVNNGGATTSQTVHTCANYMGGDIWFSFVAPASGEVIVQTNDDGNNAVGDTGMAVYDACGGLLLDCDDDDGPMFYSEVELFGLTPGATYYVAIWEGFNDAFISFDICAWDTNPPPCPPDYQFAGNGGISGTESGVADYETDGIIESNQIILAGASVDYDSDVHIELQPGFEVRLNAVFLAFIDGCNGGAGGVNLNETGEGGEK